MSNKKKIKGKGFLINGDCLEVMRTIPDNTFDVAFTSPPYAMERPKNLDIGWKQKYITQENMSPKQWFDFCVQFTDELLRVCKSHIVINIQPNITTKKYVYKFIGKYSDIIKQIIIWTKPNAQPSGTPNAFSNSYEFIFVLSNKVKRVKATSKFCRNVIVENVNANNDYKNIHKAVMNKKVADWCIKELTKEGDCVIDPFGGMATTAICCIEQNRKFCYIEKEKIYCKEAYKRIKNKLKEVG